MEREAALHSLSIHEEELLELCKDTVEVLDAFQELEIITQEEKDDANDSEDYSTVLAKLSERMNDNPSSFVNFCYRLRDLGESNVTSTADSLLGEPYTRARVYS